MTDFDIDHRLLITKLNEDIREVCLHYYNQSGDIGISMRGIGTTLVSTLIYHLTYFRTTFEAFGELENIDKDEDFTRILSELKAEATKNAKYIIRANAN